MPSPAGVSGGGDPLQSLFSRVNIFSLSDCSFPDGYVSNSWASSPGGKVFALKGEGDEWLYATDELGEPVLKIFSLTQASNASLEEKREGERETRWLTHISSGCSGPSSYLSFDSFQ